MRAPLALFAALALTACSKSSPAPAPDPAASTTAVSSVATPPPNPVASASASAPLPAAPKPPLAKSKVPTAAEWKVAPEEPLLGASSLGCDARTVREWVRVSCRGANHEGGEASSVEVTRGGGPEVYTFAKNGVASVVLRLLPGADFEAKFGWSDGKSYPLRISWPQERAARPAPIAAFVGAPEAVIDRARRREECVCYQRMNQGPTFVPAGDPCVGVPAEAFAPECLRAQEGAATLDCNPLIECQWMAPSGYAKCLPDEVYYGACPSCRCGKACGKGKPACPQGFECVEGLAHGEDGVGVCFEP